MIPKPLFNVAAGSLFVWLFAAFKSVCQNSSNLCNSNTYVRWGGLTFSWKWAHDFLLWLLSKVNVTFWTPSALQHPGPFLSRASGTPVRFYLMQSSSLHQLQNKSFLQILAHAQTNPTKNPCLHPTLFITVHKFLRKKFHLREPCEESMKRW